MLHSCRCQLHAQLPQAADSRFGTQREVLIKAQHYVEVALIYLAHLSFSAPASVRQLQQAPAQALARAQFLCLCTIIAALTHNIAVGWR